MSSVDWKDQYSRMIRWRKRLDELTSDSGYDIQDFYFAFFQNCHHLSYWLYEGNCLEEKEVKNFVYNNEYLSVCEGIANGTKHFKLTGKWYLDHYREYFSTNEGILATSSTGSSTLSSDCSPPYKGGFNPSSLKLGEYIVAIGDTTYKMIGLADKCIASWN